MIKLSSAVEVSSCHWVPEFYLLIVFFASMVIEVPQYRGGSSKTRLRDNVLRGFKRTHTHTQTHERTHSKSEGQAPCICVNWQWSTLPSVLHPCTFSTVSLTQYAWVAAASTWNGTTDNSAPHYSTTTTIPCIKTDHWGIQAGMDPQKQRYVVFP